MSKKLKPKPRKKTVKKSKTAQGSDNTDTKSINRLAAETLVKLDADDYEGALQGAEQLIRMAPERAEGYAIRSEVRMVIGPANKMLADCERALAIEPDNARYVRNRGAVFFHQQDYEKAVEYYTKAIEMAPDCAQYRADRGATWSVMEESEKAVSQLTEALKMDPNQAGWWNWRGLTYSDMGELEAAVEDMQQAVTLAPRTAIFQQNLGLTLYQLERYPEAIRHFTAAIDAWPESAEAFMHRARCHEELEQYQEVIDDCTQALELEPQNEDALSLRADVYELLGDETRAAADQEASEKIDEEKSGDEADPSDDAVEHKYGQGGHIELSGRAPRLLVQEVTEFFDPLPLTQLVVQERRFPWRMRAVIQLALEQWLADGNEVAYLCGKTYYGGMSNVLERDRSNKATPTAPQYDEVDVGGGRAIRCLKAGLWMATRGGEKHLLLMRPDSPQIVLECATANYAPGLALGQTFFQFLEQAIRTAEVYRGKILSLDSEEDYSGKSSGVRVHDLPPIAREQIVLPPRTLDLLDRNLIQFARLRQKLAERGMATKKGILFYGPPGTGKTYTIQYLAHALNDHTMLLVTADEIGLLRDYLTLARLLQPSIIILEDVDLIARQREQLRGSSEEVLMNRLLNEMDGLRPDAHVFFVLTTNHPEALEEALAARPGRIDQAIEFPLPDEEGRRRLLRLYAGECELSDEVIERAVQKTEQVSASFIKELVRRGVQFQLLRDEHTAIESADIDQALDEMLVAGGPLNRTILGASRKMGFVT